MSTNLRWNVQEDKGYDGDDGCYVVQIMDQLVICGVGDVMPY